MTHLSFVSNGKLIFRGFEVWCGEPFNATTCMSLCAFVSTCPAFSSVAVEKLFVLLLKANISPGPLDRILLCFFKNVILTVLSPVISFPAIYFL